MRPAPAILAVCLALPAFAAGNAPKDNDHSDHLAELDGVRILHAWTNATDENRAAVYMEIENETDAEMVLIGGDADIAANVHLMAMNFKNPGSFVELRGLPIAAKTAFPLTAHSVFLELHDLTTPLPEGGGFDMHIVIEPVGEIEIHVEVEAADAADHSHAGHKH